MIEKIFRGRGGQGGRGSGGGGRGGGLGGGLGQGGGGRGGNRPGSGPGGNCVCPSCGHKEPHITGQRCADRTCPKCGTRMIKE